MHFERQAWIHLYNAPSVECSRRRNSSVVDKAIEAELVFLDSMLILKKILTNRSSYDDFKISTTDISYGFYNFSAGKDPDQVYVIGFCRGDVEVSDCHTCLDFVTTNLTGLCPNQKEVIGWADNCMLRYSSRDILGGLWENEPSIGLISGDNVTTDLDQFINVLQGLLESLTNRTASGDSRLKYATGEANVTASQYVYALMQCTPDLSEFDCLGCLSWVIHGLIHGDGIRGQTGARVLHPSCYARYEVQKFYSSPDSSSLPPPSTAVTTPSSNATSRKGSGKSKIINFLCCWLRHTEKPKKLIPVKLDDGDEASSIESLQLDFNIIRDATDDFSEANQLGRGVFGAVYKGVLATGQQIAVKRLAVDSGQGESEFKNEVLLLAKLHHRNLVPSPPAYVLINNNNKNNLSLGSYAQFNTESAASTGNGQTDNILYSGDIPSFSPKAFFFSKLYMISELNFDS
ncbi:hypothetical protein V2J09_019344 [Rumex salicifolius]